MQFRADKGPWRSIEMRAVGEWRFQAEVPMEGDTREVRYFIEARDSQGRLAAHPAAGADDPIVVAITNDAEPPQVEVEPVGTARPGKDMTVTARIWDPSGIRSARLRYRHVTQFEDYENQDMQYDPQARRWSATIPGSFVVPEWELMYFIEVIDGQGNGRMYPDMETDMPYVIVKLNR
jgi:hypothetical protein